MRIAVASRGLEIASSFIQSQNFNYYTTISCQIVASQNMPEQGVSPEEHADLMRKMDVDVLICDEISDSARTTFEEQGIKVVEGKTGNALQAAEEYVAHVAECDDECDDEEEDE